MSDNSDDDRNVGKKTNAGASAPKNSKNPRLSNSTAKSPNQLPPDKKSDLAMDSWTVVGHDDISVSSMRYIDTNVGRKTGKNKIPSGQQQPSSSQYIDDVEVGTECTESIGSFSPSVRGFGSAETSVTSFSSVYAEILNCDNDVEKIRKLLELDQLGFRVTSDQVAMDSDSSTGGRSSRSSSKTSSNPQKKKTLLGFKSPSSSSKAKGSSGQKKSSKKKSPRKIIICDGKVGLVGFDASSKSRDKSPYKCEFFDVKRRPPKGKSVREVVVSEKEYKLLKKFIPPPAPPKPVSDVIIEEAAECQRTLFGWVSLDSMATSPDSLQPALSQIPEQYCRSQARLGKFGNLTEANILPSTSTPLPLPVDTTETEIEKEDDKDLENNNNEPNNENDDLSPKAKSPMSSTPTPVPQKLNRSILETVGQDMCYDVFTASETSIVLINTVFKDIIHSSDVPVALSASPKFQEFISSGNEMDALERAAEIYIKTGGKILEYLESLRNSQGFGRNGSGKSSAKPTPPRSVSTSPYISKSSTPKSGIISPGISIIKKDEDLQVQNENANDTSSGSSNVIDADANLIIPIERSHSDLSDIWCWTSERDQNKFYLSITARPGVLTQTIDCNDWQFVLSYTGSMDGIHLLGSAIRDKTEAVVPTPQCLIEMVDRNSSFAAGRLTTSKFFMAKISGKLGPLVQDFLTGKHSKPSYELKSHYRRKYRSYNVFSGVLFQISAGFHDVCRRIQSAIQRAMKIEDVLRCPRLPGLKPLSGDDNGEVAIVTANSMIDTIQDLTMCVAEIDSILKFGNNSLAALSAGIKVKKAHRKIIKLMCEAVGQLEFGHEVDFGTVVMALACNGAVIQSMSDAVPSVDIDVRSRILCSLGHLSWGAKQVVTLSRRISLLSSFVAGKTFAKLSKSNQMKTARKRRKELKDESEAKNGQRERSLSGKKNLERIVVEHRRIQEMKRQEEIQDQMTNLV